MEIDVIIDVVCPWCFVGKRELDKALDHLGRENYTVTYRPYQLAPDTPSMGVDRREYYKRKFGDGPDLARMRQYLHERGGQLGINFDFESDCIIGNTMDAHRLIKWGTSAGCQDQIVELLMQAYFEDCKNIANRELLLEIANKSGLDAIIVQNLFENDNDIAMINEEIERAKKIGVSSVPFYIFDSKSALVGAEPYDKIINFIQS